MTHPEAAGAVAVAAAVRAGRVRARVVVDRTLALIQQRDRALNCFTDVLAERALAQADAIDAQVAAGRDPGRLAGVPFAVKNLFDIAGRPTIAGSLILRNAPPATADAALIQRLERDGAILVGALNMDEFAYGFSTENAHYGTTRNPHAPERIAGGSSGGSAAAVAAVIVPLTLGSDTNGSVRVPAAMCGVFGLKPTFGRLSRTGMFPFVDSLDHAGLFAASIADLALAYDVMQGRDLADMAQDDRACEPAYPALGDSVAGLRVAVLGGWFDRFAGPGVRDAVDHVAAALGGLPQVEIAETGRARAAAFCLTAAEGGALHRARLRDRPDEFDPATRDRLIAGTLVPGTVVAAARQFRERYLATALAVFKRYDLLIAPATICAAPRIGEASVCLDGIVLPVRANLGLYTQPISFIGLPVVSAPVAIDGPLPVGIQIIAPPWREDLALRLAAALEARAVVRTHPLPLAVEPVPLHKEPVQNDHR